MSEEIKEEEREECPKCATIQERKRWLLFGLPFTFTTYSFNAKKLTYRKGLLTTHEDDILLYRIMDTSLCRSLFQKIFKLGTIFVSSSDQTMPELVIKNIRNVRDFKEELDERIERERRRWRVRTGELFDTDGDGRPDDDFHDHHDF